MAVSTTFQNGSVIAWQTPTGISFQLIDPQGVPISSVMVQDTPSVWTSAAPLSNGGFSIIWDSGFGAQPMAQDYGVDGSAVGAPYPLSGLPPTAPMASTSLELPMVTSALAGVAELTTALPNDDRVVVTTENPTGFNPVLQVQQLDPQGNQIGPTLTQPFSGLGNVGDAVTTSLAGGNYVVTYTHSANLSAELYSDLFNADGTLAASTLVAQTSGTQLFGPHATAALPDGGFVMAWVATGGPGIPPPQALFIEEFLSDGSAAAAPQMLAFIPPVTSTPEIVAFADGRYTISWTPGGVGTPQVATFTEHGAPLPDYTNAAIFTPALTYTLPAGPHEVILVADAAQSVTGNDLGDRIVSNDFASTLSGRQGNDTLVAGHDANVMTGGGGSDNFVLPYVPLHAGQITDFNTVHDRIDLTGILDSIGDGGRGNPFAKGTFALGSDGHGGTELFFHAPGSGSPVAIVDIDNVAMSQLHRGDFILHS
jgi:hypothetical protein